MNRFRDGRSDRPSDRGATTVEFALIVPLLLLMLGSMLDIGLAVLGRSVASDAAREGARVGIIHFDDANVVGSANYDRIEAAARAKVVGLISPDTSNPLRPFVEVRCLDGATKAPIVPGGTCARGAVQIDRDLIEVTVRWVSISPSGGVFTPDSYANRTRMVIVGDGAAGSGGPPSTSEIGFAGVTDSTTEGNVTTSVQLTVTRSNGVGIATVAYTPAPGSATAPADYVSVPGQVSFLDGQTTQTITIDIVGDGTTEAAETFTVTLSAPVNGTIRPGFGTTTVTILDDDVSTVAPQLVSLRMFDDDADGRIDRVTATFDEVLAAGCPSPGAITFPTRPSGLSLQSVSTTGMVATLALNEGSVDTSNTNLTVALAAGCIRDVDGNSATFGATTPTDGAAAVLVTVTDSDTTGVANGTFEQADWVDFTFSEPLNPATLLVAAGNVVLSDPPGNGNDTLQILGLLNGSIDLGSNAYEGPNNRAATFPSSTIALTTGNRVIRVTLVNACSPGNACGNNLGQGSGSVTFTFVTTLRAPDGLPISSGPFTVSLF